MSKIFKYYECDDIGIQFCKLFGVKNPELLIMGSLKQDNINFIVTADDKPVKINIIPLSNKNDFCIEAPFAKKAKIVKFYIEIKGNKKLIIAVKNLMIIRAV